MGVFYTDFGAFGCRMGEHDLHLLLFGWDTVDMFGGYWGIYWKNIFGSETSAEIYNQRED